MQDLTDSLLLWMKGQTAPPAEVQIYPTNICNLSCVFCVQTTGEYIDVEEVSDSRWIEVIEEICGMGTKRILISGGGEPLVRKNLITEMIKILKNNGVNGRMIHNGTLWDPASAEVLVDQGWDSVTFSIDGGCAETHDALRGTASFDKIVENIRLINRIKQAKQKEQPRLEINFVLCNRNFNEIGDLTALASDLDIASVNFEPICINNDYSKELQMNISERKLFFEKYVPKAQAIADQHHIQTNIDRLQSVKVLEKTGDLGEEINKEEKKQEKYKGTILDAACFEPWLWPKIEANGEVWPCSTSPLDENIKGKSFAEIWYGNVFSKFRQDIINRKLSDACSNCVLSHLATNNSIREVLIGAVEENR